MTTTSRHSSSFRLWSKRIDVGVISRYQCVQAANAIWPLGEMAMPFVGGHRTNLTEDEAYELVCRIQNLPNGMALTMTHEQAGALWLARYAKRFGLPEGQVVNFRFVGCHYYWDNGTRAFYMPTYRTTLLDGRRFDYAPHSWQARNWRTGRDEPIWFEWINERSTA